MKKTYTKDFKDFNELVKFLTEHNKYLCLTMYEKNLIDFAIENNCVLTVGVFDCNDPQWLCAKTEKDVSIMHIYITEKIKK